MPEVPTLAESGVPGVNLQTWNALSAPPKTPAAVVAKLNDAVTDAMNSPEAKAIYSKLFLLPGVGNPAEVPQVHNGGRRALGRHHSPSAPPAGVSDSGLVTTDDASQNARWCQSDF